MSDRTPRVALVHDWLTGMRGGEKVLEAIAGLFPQAPIYTLLYIPGTVSAALEKHPIHTSFIQRAPAVARRYRGYLPLFPAAIESFDLTAYDLVISSSHCVAKGAIPSPGAVHVCYCHTPVRYAWDQEHAYFPRRRGIAARIRGQLLSALRTWDAASATRVDRFLANSSFVADRIRRYYGRSAHVLPPPVAIDFFTPDDGRRESFALAVSALAPYKRLDLAIAGCRRAGVPLKIVGSGPERRRLEGLGSDGVEFLDRVDGEHLRDLYRRARCFVQTGTEDFGIAAVEALACGCPVVALDRGGVRDIVTNGDHGVLFSRPDDADAVAAAVDKAARLRFNSLDLRGRASAFSAQRFVDGFQAFLNSTLSEAAPV